ncbi:redoxin domain-containing protein [Paraglaciecola sp.]|uniref:redoxin domain-containing protein n=1 Tax=Paraglaciecola sp. TaxID=1920173 RepID=UPI0030F456C9
MINDNVLTVDSQQHRIIPSETLPTMMLKTVESSTHEISQTTSTAHWKLVVVYRGLHCPMCKQYLVKLQNDYQGFVDAGIDLVAISADSKVKAAQMIKQDCKLEFPIAYGMSVTQMRQLNLYLSKRINGEDAEAIFPEPAVFILQPKGLLHTLNISNAPYMRPAADSLLSTIQYLKLSGENRHDSYGGDIYPIRGTF